MSSAPETTVDSRDSALVEAHSLLAKEALRVMTARTLEIAQEHPEEASEILKASATLKSEEKSKYDVKVTLGGLLYVFAQVDFPIRSYQFFGTGGGLALGAQVTWGTAWFNYPIESIIGWDARFEMNYSPVASNINLWGMHGETIGSVVAGGVGIGQGIVGGQGTFRDWRGELPK